MVQAIIMALGVALQYCNYMLALTVSISSVLQVLSKRLWELAKFNEHTNVLCSRKCYFSVICTDMQIHSTMLIFPLLLTSFVPMCCKKCCLCLQDNLLCILLYSYIGLYVC